MKQIMQFILNSAIAIGFFAVLFLIKIHSFHQLPYFIHFFVYLLSISFTYMIVLPAFIKAALKNRKKVIYSVILITFALSFLWNAEHAYFFNERLYIDLYFIPIILSALFLSMRTGIALAAAAAVSYTIFAIVGDVFSIALLAAGLCLFMALALAVIIISRVLGHRDRMVNKREILVRESNALVLGMNSEGKIDLCNKRMAEFLGLEEKNILNQYFWKVDKQIENKEALKIFNLLHDKKDHANDELDLEIGDEICSFILDSYTLEDDGFNGGKMIVLRNINERKKMERQLLELSITDELTGLYNRRHFEAKFREEITRSQRYHHPISLIIVDLDHFKSINDTYGHLTGDQVLKQVSTVLAKSVRMTDTCARFGGEEFTVLLPETDAQEAFDVASRIHQNIKDVTFAVEQGTLRVTASLGVTSRSADFTIHGMLDEADKALYSAKEMGRDQIAAAG